MRQFYLTVFSLLVLNAFGQTPKMTVSTTGINVPAAVGATVTQTFTITNTGNRDMTWEFSPEGEPVEFRKRSNTDFSQPENQDRITDNVWITRKETRGLFNAAQETSYSSYYSPAGTEWAYGHSRDLSSEDYEVWQEAINSRARDMVGNVISMRAIQDDRYFDLLFTSFEGDGAGSGFSYERTEYFSWISADVSGGTLLPGQSATITLTFDATNLSSGVRNGAILLHSNASNADVYVPFTFTVTGGLPDLDADSYINLGGAYVGFPIEGSITIENDGTGVLNVTNVTSSNPAFTVGATTFSIAPGNTFALPVQFTASLPIVYDAELTITSNDADENPFIIELEAGGINPPVIDPATSSYSVTVPGGSTYAALLTLSNNGAAGLEYSVAFDLGMSQPVTFTKENYADPNLAENHDRVTENVWITRGDRQGFFNIATEGGFDGSVSPANTEWANTNTADASYYDNWRDAWNGDPREKIGVTTSMHIIDQDRYFDVTLNSWQCCEEGGAFSYTRREVYNWLNSSVKDGFIAAGDNQDIDLNFSAVGLPAGVYHGSIVITSNDPVNPLVTIPVVFTVTGTPDISVPQTEIDFGGAQLGYRTTKKLHILNEDYGSADISSIVISGTEVSTTTESLSIDGFGRGIVELTFTPAGIESYSGTITLTTTDAANPTIVIPYTAEGLGNGNLQITVPDMTATVTSGNFVEKVIVIENTGAGDLTWSLSSPNTNSAVTFSKEDYADWRLEGNQDRISDHLWITRADNRGLFNIAEESNYSYGVSPKGTLWHAGPTVNANPGGYEDWRGAVNGPPNSVGKTFSMYSVKDREYYDVTFNSWTDDGNGGGFSYERRKAAGWMKASAWSGTVAPGASFELTITLDPANYVAGTYDNTLVIETNDLDAEPVVIPVHLTVQGVPDLVTSLASLDFSDVGLNMGKQMEIEIKNEGTDVLNITDITSSDAAFSVNTSTGTLAVEETMRVVVTFTPTAATAYTGTISIVSNDPDDSPVVINVSGDGILVPDISVTPAEIIALQPTGTTLDGQITIANTGEADLHWTASNPDDDFPTLLARLNSNFAQITDAIPNRYDFVYDGSSSISDGGNDMFDGGNVLNTSLGLSVPYSDNVVVAGDTWFGAGTTYFTRHLTGLFVMAADLNNVSEFYLSGNNGADGGGSAEGKKLVINVNDIVYNAFVKRVYNAGDPSINQVMIIEQNTNAVFDVATNTDDSYSSLDGIDATTRIYYLLYATAGGVYSDDATVKAVVENFLSVISGGAGFVPDWISLSTYSGTIGAGASATVDYTIDVTSLPEKMYEANIGIASNDPDEKTVSIPVRMNSGTVVVVNEIEDVHVNEGFGSHQIDIANVFVDANDDALSLIPASSETGIVTANLAGNTLTLNETGTGTAIISVRADDGNGNVAFADFSFRVNDVPDVVAPIASQTITIGTGLTIIDIASVFADSDAQDVLTFSIQNSNGAVIDVTLNGTNIEITDLALGSSTITITVEDGSGGTVSTTFTVNVEKIPAEITLGNTSVVYNGQAHAVTVTTEPANLTVAVTYTLDGEVVTAPTNAGVYNVTATVNDDDYAATLTGTLTIAKAAASVTLSNTTVTYNGQPQAVTVTTNPANLAVVTTYTLGGTAVANPEDAGLYNVTVTVDETNYSGTASGNLDIAKATQTITFGEIDDMFNSAEPFSLVATSTSGLPVTFTLVSGPATISGDVVTLTGELGEVMIQADQSGNGNYEDATAVVRSFTVTEDPILSSDDAMQAFISVYPVPTRDYLSISTGTYIMKRVQLIDSFGRVVTNEAPNNTSHQLDVRAHTSGVYMLQIVTEKGVSTRRVLIRK